MVMERLTEKTVGCFEYALKDHKAVPGEFGTYDAFFDYSMAVKRLGHYEDSGLEPEEIADFMKRWEQTVEIGGMLKKYGIDHIRDIIKAEQDGRMVVLPCKVGDTVYEISNNTDACNGCQHYEGIYGSGESWCAQIDDVDLRCYPNIAEKPLCEKQFMEVVEYKPEIDWIFTHRNDFGKTVFLTREEAEAALKGGEG